MAHLPLSVMKRCQNYVWGMSMSAMKFADLSEAGFPPGVQHLVWKGRAERGKMIRN